MPLPKAPSFGSSEYWNARFTSNPNPFEWLEAPNSLDPYLVEALKNSNEEEPEVLHIGCGTSLLSYHLRAHVKSPRHIHNLDYSDVAIEVGRKREVDIFASEHEQEAESLGNDVNQNSSSTTTDDTDSRKTAARTELAVIGSSEPLYMRWSSANLLSHSSVLKVCQPASYSIVVDKSTSDSIACSEDVYIPLPYPVRTSKMIEIPPAKASRSSEPIHPVHMLALHLALVTKPGGKWISLSYSSDRFPFLPGHVPGRFESDPSPSKSPASTSVTSTEEEDFEDGLDDNLDEISQQVLDQGFPHPGGLWRLEGKYEIEVPEPHNLVNGGEVHRPKILHWVYILARTDVELIAMSD
ncbi:hypothetical protein BCR34DRAFT_255451 [Clohesyomyces aquaticus]|uniref:S-adenosyl-L-methionine-dependent methyltransferase n=1 Tax=Clohesyomyces aquaticus TaxID=1231657 RepID=A0A1Y1ZU03_9PLEO|nr:hypothetical protein BCR34DRAFT_255451 [Clohesyomyces aquaticus]